jgi:hypothetical protein
MSDASPPLQPPQMSPDGQWVWNGAEWQPVGTHRSVFPSWNSIRVEPAQPAAAPAQAVMTQPEPVVSYPVYAVADVAAPPLWQPKSTGINKYLYWVAGAIVVIIGFILLNSMAPFISWPWSGGSEAAPAASPLPALATRSDYARSDRFVRVELTPAMDALTPTFPVLKETCVGLLTVSCQSAITAADKQVKLVLAAINRETVPACIAAPVAKLRADLVATDLALQTGTKGYTDNSQAEVNQGVAVFKKASAPLAADAAAVTPASHACGTEVVGP